jgi:hypothetical protein
MISKPCCNNILKQLVKTPSAEFNQLILTSGSLCMLVLRTEDEEFCWQGTCSGDMQSHRCDLFWRMQLSQAASVLQHMSVANRIRYKCCRLFLIARDSHAEAALDAARAGMTMQHVKPRARGASAPQRVCGVKIVRLAAAAVGTAVLLYMLW